MRDCGRELDSLDLGWLISPLYMKVLLIKIKGDNLKRQLVDI